MQVPAGDRAVHDVALVANTELVVEFGYPVNAVEVLSDGAADIYLTTDGTPATVEGGNCERIPAGGTNAGTIDAPYGMDTTVRLISAGTPSVSITRR